MTTDELVNKWIKELQEAGFSYDEMIEVFQLAKLKFEARFKRVYIVRGRYYKEAGSDEVKIAKHYDVEKMQYYYFKNR